MTVAFPFIFRNIEKQTEELQNAQTIRTFTFRTYTHRVMGPKNNNNGGQTIYEAISSLEEKIDERFDKLQDTLDKFALKEDIEKVKRCTRLNAYAQDKVEQYTSRDNVQISGLKLDR